MDEWIERLEDQPLHGGIIAADQADFRLYAEITRLDSLPMIKAILKSRPKGCKFVNWFKLMDKYCAPRRNF